MEEHGIQAASVRYEKEENVSILYSAELRLSWTLNDDYYSGKLTSEKVCLALVFGSSLVDLWA
jgi:hypothetical protein